MSGGIGTKPVASLMMLQFVHLEWTVLVDPEKSG